MLVELYALPDNDKLLCNGFTANIDTDNYFSNFKPEYENIPCIPQHANNGSIGELFSLRRH